MTTQEIIGILDRSGSMRGKEEDTVGGINTMINEVKKNKGEDDIVRVSLKLVSPRKWNLTAFSHL